MKTMLGNISLEDDHHVLPFDSSMILFLGRNALFKVCEIITLNLQVPLFLLFC